MSCLRFLLFALLAVAAGARAATLQPVLEAEQGEDLAQPHDAALSPDGRRLYVTDMANSRIVVLDARTLARLEVFGQGELSYPHDAEFDAAGRLLVADTGKDRIAIYTVGAGKPRLVGELGGLGAPEGVAVMPDGRVLATNVRTGTLAVFRDGRLERSIGRQGSGPGEFSRPHDVDAAPDGTVYVVDSGNDRVQVFDAQLRLRTSFGPALKLSGPKYLSLDAGRLWLADEYNHRILLLDADHRLLGQLGGPESGRAAHRFYKPEAVVARGQDLWVVDTYNNRVLRYRLPAMPVR